MLLLFIGAAIGATIIITMAKITESFRDWISSWGQFFRELIYCQMCMGFWIGMASAVGYLAFDERFLLVYNKSYQIGLFVFCMGCVSSLLSYFAGSWISIIKQKK